MNKALKFLLTLCLAAPLLICTTFAASVTEGNVTYTYSISDDSILITDIGIDQSVTSPMDVEIPATIDGVSVISVGLQSLATETADMIASLDFSAFDGGDLPEINGNLFQWQYQGGSHDITTNGYSLGNVPDTETLLASIPGFVSDSYVDGVYYVGENLVRVDPNYSGDLIIQDGTISILASAMEGCSNLGNVTIPDSVEWIGVRAFANSSVTSVNLPKGLFTDGSKSIEMAVFYGCTELETVTFPTEGSLDRVGYLAFFGCESLTGFDFTRVGEAETLSFAKAFVDGVAIDLSYTETTDLAIFSHSGVGSVTFGTNAVIGTELFYQCESLTEINGFEYVVSLYAWAFEGCTALAQDVMADCTMTSMGSAYRAFADTAMTELTIPACVTSMTGAMFAGNEQLETVNWYGSYGGAIFSVLNDVNKGTYFNTSYSMPVDISDFASEYTFPKTFNFYAMSSSPGTAFANQPYLETVNIYCDITAIPDYLFQFCPNLSTVTFQSPELITSIGYSAFQGALSLTSFPFTEMPELESIANSAFLLTNGSVDASTGYGLTEIDLSQCTKLTASTIGTGAFLNQYSATTLHLPANFGIGGYTGAFNGTVSMTELICDGDMESRLIAYAICTGGSGFNDNLETVTVMGEIVNGGDAIFCRMTNLKTVNLPNATSIPATCFLGCTALETVYAPNVTEVGNSAFMGSGITEAVVSADVTYGYNVFDGRANLTTVVVEEGRTELSDFMFENCTALEEISLPSSLSTINWGAFKNANAMLVDIPASVDTIEDDAFSGGEFQLIFRGAPLVNLTHEDYSGSGENTLLPIEETATIYYATDAAKTAAELYQLSAPGLTISEAPADVTLSITGAPTDVLTGEALDLTDFVVTYNGEALTAEQYTLDYSAADTSTGVRTVTLTVTDTTAIGAGGVFAIDISATDLSGDAITGAVPTVVSVSDAPTITFDVTVSSPIVTSSIEVNSTSHKTAYMVDDLLDVTDLTILVTMSDASTETVAVTSDMVSDFDSSVAASQTLTITYDGVTTTYDVTISAPVVTATIAVNSTSHKTAYMVDNLLDVTDLTILVTKSDASTETVAVTADLVSGFDSSAAVASQTLTITYDGVTTTFDVTISAPVVTATIQVSSTSHKTAYMVGDALDVTDLTILVTKSDASTETVAVTADMVNGFDSSAAATSQTLTITYDGVTTTYEISITKTSSSSSSSSSTTTTTVNNSDGSVTTTVTNKTTGTVTETTKTADGVTSTVVTDVSGEITQISASVPSDVAAEATASGEAVTLPVEVPVADSTEDAIAIEVNVPSSGATIEIPVENITAGTVVIIVNGDGTETVVTDCYITDVGVVFTLDDDATVKIVDNSKSFDDVQGVDHWATEAIDFVTARGLFNGISDTTFAPDAPMTRGMLAVVLHNLEYNPNSTSGSNFGDVPTDSWYSNAINWAAEAGILSGYDSNTFGGDDNVTREQLAVMLWRYAGSPESDNNLDCFTDADEISDYATQALAWAYENGILSGYGNGYIGATDNATRAQVAQILTNFLTNI